MDDQRRRQPRWKGHLLPARPGQRSPDGVRRCPCSRRGRGRERTAVAVAAVDGGKDSYWHRRADGTDPLAMLLDESIPLVERHLGSEPPARAARLVDGGIQSAARRRTTHRHASRWSPPRVPRSGPSPDGDPGDRVRRSRGTTQRRVHPHRSVAGDDGPDRLRHRRPVSRRRHRARARLPIRITAGSAPASTTPPIGAASPPTTRHHLAHAPLIERTELSSTPSTSPQGEPRTRSDRGAHGRRVVRASSRLVGAGRISQAHALAMIQVRRHSRPLRRHRPTQPIARTHRLTRSCRAREPRRVVPRWPSSKASG